MDVSKLEDTFRRLKVDFSSPGFTMIIISKLKKENENLNKGRLKSK